MVSGRLDHRQDRGSSSKVTHGCSARERTGTGSPSADYGIHWANPSSWIPAHSHSGLSEK